MDNFDLFPQMNSKREVFLTRSSDRSTTWRSNLSSLLKGQSSRKTGKISSMFSPYDNWNVDSAVKLVMTDNKPIKIENKPDEPLQKLVSGMTDTSTLVGKIGTALAGIASGVSALRNSLNEGNNTSGAFNPWFSNIHTWKSGQPINVTSTFEFAMGQYGLWNAKEEVVKPILNLLAPCLPQYMNSFMQYGAFPNTLLLITSLIKDVFGEMGIEFDFEKKSSQTSAPDNPEQNTETEGSLSTNEINSLAEKIESFVLREYKNFTFDIRYGNTFTFYKMLPVSASPKFSNEFDQYGYPISGNIEIRFLGLMPVTLTSSTEEERAARFGSFTRGLNGISPKESISSSSGTTHEANYIL